MRASFLMIAALVLPVAATAHGAPPQDVVIYPNALSSQSGTIILSEPHCPDGYTLVADGNVLKCAPVKSLIDPKR